MSILDDIKASLAPSTENGTLLTLGVLGGLSLLAAASRGGVFTGNVSAGPIQGSFSYQGSRATAWNDYVGKRVPELMAQGKSAPQAMRAAADEYHGRS